MNSDDFRVTKFITQTIDFNSTKTLAVHLFGPTFANPMAVGIQLFHISRSD